MPTDLVSVPLTLLTEQQRQILLGEQPAVVSEKLDAKQLAKAQNVSERTIDVWKQKGIIPFQRVGRIVRFNLKDVNKALEQYNVRAKKI